jgi:hypothetical protein
MTGNEGPFSCTYNKECFHDFPFLNATCGYILFSLSPSVCSNNIEICLCCEGSHRLHISRKPTMPYIRKYTSVSLHEKVYFVYIIIAPPFQFSACVQQQAPQFVRNISKVYSEWHFVFSNSSWFYTMFAFCFHHYLHMLTCAHAHTWLAHTNMLGSLISEA